MNLKTTVKRGDIEMLISTVGVLGEYETIVVLVINGEPDYGMELACERHDNADDAFFNHLSAIYRAELGRFDDMVAMYQ